MHHSENSTVHTKDRCLTAFCLYACVIVKTRPYVSVSFCLLIQLVYLKGFIMFESLKDILCKFESITVRKVNFMVTLVV